MENDLSNMKEGDLVIIASDVSDPHNSELYIHAGTSWKLLSDLSGLQGIGVATVIKTSGNGAPGTTDIYTITLTDGRETTFTVYNGKDGTGSGDMVSDIYDKNKIVADAGGIAEYVEEHGTKVIIRNWNA